MTDAAAAKTDASVRFKLSLMMFLEFFIWGAWLPLIFGYLPSLGFTPLQQSWVLNAFALASFTAMFFFTQFADRNFAAERFVAFSHFVGGVSIFALAWITSFWPFFLLMLVHSLFYVPTISITNSIAFANLSNPQHEFGRVRLWGTIGWIAASWPFVFILVDWASVPAMADVGFVKWLGAALGTPKSGPALQDAVKYTFITSGIASLILAGMSLSLPHTPPRPAKAGDEKFAWLEAVLLLKVPYVLVLFVVTFFDAAVHQCYFVWTNDYLKSIGIPANWVMPVMSIGQVAEVGTMAVLGYCLKALGWRNIMVLGILGHTVRFAVFALVQNPAVAILVNVMHGVCYAFFFATVYIFVDEFFPKNVRSSAQGLFNFLILGLGPFVGNFVWPMLGDTSRVIITRNEFPPVWMFADTETNVALTGKAPANSKVKIRFETQDKKPMFEVDTEANEKGEWSIPEQRVKVPYGHQYYVTPEGKATFTQASRIDYRKLLLYPSGTALFAAILLLLFFHPPKTKIPADNEEAVSEGADVPHV
jgi:nucleoside transporter